MQAAYDLQAGVLGHGSSACGIAMDGVQKVLGTPWYHCICPMFSPSCFPFACLPMMLRLQGVECKKSRNAGAQVRGSGPPSVSKLEQLRSSRSTNWHTNFAFTANTSQCQPCLSSNLLLGGKSETRREEARLYPESAPLDPIFLQCPWYSTRRRLNEPVTAILMHFIEWE